ncbi:hypothetical protein [Lichenicola sp.]|uniref:hypothetical protein n=1 Tax=Lichenicola sp. TaxID=2804529 RepID=UPI003AFFAA0D
MDMFSAPPRFDDDGLLASLCAMSEEELDGLDFGILGLNHESIVTVYNRHEERSSGLSRARVIGRHCFHDVAPCMNNFMVAERVEHERPLDCIIPYVLTFRMRPTSVRLRMLCSAEMALRWILVARV